jgi:alkylation response protein AidB-like acyl-CoA dehydrogenase
MSTETQETQPAHHEPLIDTSGMSEGKRKALELAESSRDEGEGHASFAGGLFMGRYDLSLIQPFPVQPESDRQAGADFLRKIEQFVLEHVDGDAIDRTGEIPPEVIDGLRELGAFGIKIGKEYGGLGLSQTNYTKTAMLVGGECASTAALISAHQSIGVPQPLKLFGSPEQKKRFMPRLARGELSAFALTEEEAGSDPARMTTRADLSEDGTHYVVNGEKLWCTNGTRADLLVVMAQTAPKVVRGRERPQISAFIVEVDTPGVEIAHVCQFMGHRAIANGVVKFTDVKVPAENLIWAEGRGLKVALSTLNTGRLTLPAAATGVAKRCLRITREWAKKREQWGASIGKHSAVADKIGRMAATVFAMESMVLLTSALVDQGGRDIRIESAMCKMWGCEAGWRVINDCMQIRGGRGYETEQSLKDRGVDFAPVERFLRDARIHTIFEGSSEIMRLLLAREALDPHLKVAGGVLDSRLPMGKRAAAAVRAGLFYAPWYPARWWPFPSTGARGLHPTLDAHAARLARASQRVARKLFHSMARFGPDLENQQVLLGRFVEAGTEIFAASATISRAQSMIDRGEAGDEVVRLADYFCREALKNVDLCFRGVGRNNDRMGYALAQDVMGGQYAWAEADTVQRDTNVPE